MIFWPYSTIAIVTVAALFGLTSGAKPAVRVAAYCLLAEMALAVIALAAGPSVGASAPPAIAVWIVVAGIVQCAIACIMLYATRTRLVNP